MPRCPVELGPQFHRRRLASLTPVTRGTLTRGGTRPCACPSCRRRANKSAIRWLWRDCCSGTSRGSQTKGYWRPTHVCRGTFLPIRPPRPTCNCRAFPGLSSRVRAQAAAGRRAFLGRSADPLAAGIPSLLDSPIRHTCSSVTRPGPLAGYLNREICLGVTPAPLFVALSAHAHRRRTRASG